MAINLLVLLKFKYLIISYLKIIFFSSCFVGKNFYIFEETISFFDIMKVYLNIKTYSNEKIFNYPFWENTLRYERKHKNHFRGF